MYAIEIVGLADGRPSPIAGSYLRECDVDARGGRGQVIGTADIGSAMLFATHVEAHEYWARPSTVVPFRPDGKPNRPMTSYTVNIVKVEPREVVVGDIAPVVDGARR